MQLIRKYWEEKPLILLLFIGGFFRLLAAFFAKGYGMSDDHFLVIEPSQSWVDGYDYNNWLPTITKGLTQASGHSLLYPGIHYLLFLLFKFLGIVNPDTKMILVRILHAAYSMIVIVVGFKITAKLSNKDTARFAGLLLAIFFFMPWLSVRNLVEVVCIPPLMLATWYIIKFEKDNYRAGLYAGIMLGIAFCIRFQTAMFISGFGLAMIFMQRWKNIAWLILGFIISVGIVQMVTDVLIWKKPFVEFAEYVRYNLANSETYGVSSWYKYLLLISGILIPPMSIMLIFGFLKTWRKYIIIFLPAFLFFIFHSTFPNKQERFIMPVIPFVIIGGMIGWQQLINSTSKIWLRKFNRVAWIIFFVLNTIPLFVVSVSYSKRSRVESMLYIYNKKDTQTICVEESIHGNITLQPQFYLTKWGKVYEVTLKHSINDLLCDFKMTEDKKNLPQYVLFNQEDSLPQRIASFKKFFPNITFETEVQPGFIDKLLHRLNPRNSNFTVTIYKMHYKEEEMTSIKSAPCN